MVSKDNQPLSVRRTSTLAPMVSSHWYYSFNSWSTCSYSYNPGYVLPCRVIKLQPIHWPCIDLSVRLIRNTITLPCPPC